MTSPENPYLYEAILLSGPPASGKDSLTEALHGIDPKFVHFRKHRAGSGGQPGAAYIDISVSQFERMAQQNRFAQWHDRYGRYYGVAVEELDRTLSTAKIPIIHVGKYQNLLALRQHPLLRPALSILLLCSRAAAGVRLENRHAGQLGEVEARLAAFDQEQQTLRDERDRRGLLDFDLVTDSGSKTVSQLARSIATVLSNGVAVAERRQSCDTLRSFLE